MLTSRASLVGSFDVDASAGLAASVALTSVDASGYVAAESLMFRALKGAIEPYLHAAQRTVIHAWQPATGEWAVEVRRGEHNGRSAMMESIVWREGAPVLEQRARLRMVASLSGHGPSGTSRLTADDALATAGCVATWRPSEDEVRAYSGWGHPNVHTDLAFARSVGHDSTLVQGLMIQNRLLAELARKFALVPPLVVDTRFRAVVPVGADIELVVLQCEGSTNRLAARVNGSIACDVSVEPAR